MNNISTQNVYSMNANNLFIQKPTFESEIMNRTIQYALYRNGSNNWHWGFYLYFKWQILEQPHITEIRVFYEDIDDKKKREEFIINPLIEQDWKNAESLLKEVLDVLESTEKRQKLTNGFGLELKNILPFYPLEHELYLLSKVDLSHSRKDVEISYFISTYLKPYTTIKISTITFMDDSQKIILGFIGLSDKYLEIKTDYGKYIFTNQYNYGTWKNDKGDLQRGSCGFRDNNEYYGELISRKHIENAKKYIMTLIQILYSSKN